jgi:hypothetical protein
MKFIPFALFCCAFATIAAAETPPGHPPIDHKVLTDQLKQEQNLEEFKNRGKVITLISVNSYVYLEVDPDEGDKNVWIALPDSVEVKEGDRVRYKDGPVMKDFTSNTLNRTFESVIFLSEVVVD